jgi:hypothetical protein
MFWSDNVTSATNLCEHFNDTAGTSSCISGAKNEYELRLRARLHTSIECEDKVIKSACTNTPNLEDTIYTFTHTQRDPLAPRPPLRVWGALPETLSVFNGEEGELDVAGWLDPDGGSLDFSLETGDALGLPEDGAVSAQGLLRFPVRLSATKVPANITVTLRVTSLQGIASETFLLVVLPVSQPAPAVVALGKLGASAPPTALRLVPSLSLAASKANLENGWWWYLWGNNGW